MRYTVQQSCLSCRSSNTKIVFNYKKKNLKDFLYNYYNLKHTEQIIEEFKFVIIKCLDCGNNFQKYILNNQELERFYNDVISLRETNIEKKVDKTDRNVRLANYISKQLNKKIDVLDFGSGNTNYLKEYKNINFFTFDISKTKKSKNNIDSIEILKKKKFDLIIVNQVLEHINNPSETAKIFNEILKNNGLIKIEVPSSYLNRYKFFLTYILGPKKNLIHDFFPIEHINSYTSYSLKHLFCNLNCVDIKNYYWIENNYNIKNIFKYMIIISKILKFFSTILFLKNGGHYLIFKKLSDHTNL